MLATEPATTAQVAAVVAEFGRLGVRDRAGRLAISADLLGLDHLESTRHLVMGDAGRLIAILRNVEDRSGLPAVIVPARAAADGRDRNRGASRPVALADVLGQLGMVLTVVFASPDARVRKPPKLGAKISRLRAREGGVYSPRSPVRRYRIASRA